jgi:hypothetical protein
MARLPASGHQPFLTAKLIREIGLCSGGSRLLLQLGALVQHLKKKELYA